VLLFLRIVMKKLEAIGSLSTNEKCLFASLGTTTFRRPWPKKICEKVLSSNLGILDTKILKECMFCMIRTWAVSITNNKRSPSPLRSRYSH